MPAEITWQVLALSLEGARDWRYCMTSEVVQRTFEPKLVRILNRLMEIDPRIASDVYNTLCDGLDEVKEAATALMDAMATTCPVPETADQEDAEAKLAELMAKSGMRDESTFRAITDVRYAAQMQERALRLSAVIESRG